MDPVPNEEHEEEQLEAGSHTSERSMRENAMDSLSHQNIAETDGSIPVQEIDDVNAVLPAADATAASLTQEEFQENKKCSISPEPVQPTTVNSTDSPQHEQQHRETTGVNDRGEEKVEPSSAKIKLGDILRQDTPHSAGQTRVETAEESEASPSGTNWWAGAEKELKRRQDAFLCQSKR